MDERACQQSDDFREMIRNLAGIASRRQACQFVAGCVRLSVAHAPHGVVLAETFRSMAIALDVVGRYAEGYSTDEELDAALRGVWGGGWVGVLGCQTVLGRLWPFLEGSWPLQLMMGAAIASAGLCDSQLAKAKHDAARHAFANAIHVASEDARKEAESRVRDLLLEVFARPPQSSAPNC